MKAAPAFLSTVSAITLALSPVVAGSVAVTVATVAAVQAATVSSISVSGNQRVGTQTIADFIGFQPGKNYSGADLDEAVKTLVRTGLFSDASVSISGSTLVVQVQEFGIVNQILFQGNRKLKDDRLRAAIKLQPRTRFEQSTLDADVDAIVDAYSSVGRADVQVNASVVDLGENRVNVVFNINEGDRTKIAQINFTGNNAYGDRRLQGVISTKRSNFLSWLTRNDVYDDQRLAADEEQLRRFYFNHGYADFRVINSSVENDPNSGNLVINIEVDEGERYTFGNIDIDSTISGVSNDDLARTVQTRSGDTYSAEDVEDTLISMSEKLAAAGFPFAEVTPVGNRNFETRTIDVSYIVDQGQRAYIERIEIVGNTRTRDYVIRREFDLAEGDAFNQILIRRAQKRLEALDFFERVQVSTRPGTAADRVIVVVQVADKPTGELGAGVGYATGGDNAGISVEASIIERNFLGRGQAVKFSVGGGAKTRTYNLSFTEPYFLGYRMSATLNLFQNRKSFDDQDYDKKTQGGSVSFGLPLNDHLTGNFGYTYARDSYTAQGDADATCFTDQSACDIPAAVVDRLGNPRVKSAINYGLTFNTIDNRADPHEGLYARINQEVAGLGGDAKYIKTTADATYYQTLNEEADIVAKFSAGAGNITGWGGGLSQLDHFELGQSHIRGFEFNGIGPTVNGNHVGGTNYLNATAEVQFPFPAIPRDLGLKGSFFADAATLWGVAPGVTADAGTADMALRASVGVGLIWNSPFAPLRFDYAIPVVKEDSDQVQNFNFSVSTAF